MSPDEIITTISENAEPENVPILQRYFLMKFYWYMGHVWVCRLTGAENHSSASYAVQTVTDNPKYFKDVEKISFLLNVEPPNPIGSNGKFL